MTIRMPRTSNIYIVPTHCSVHDRTRSSSRVLGLLALGLVAAGCGDDGSSEVSPLRDAAVTESRGTEGFTDTPSPASTNDEATTKREGPWGCYLEDHHRCDCSVESELDCDGVGLWVEGCATCGAINQDAGATVDDTSTTLDTSASDAGDTEFGCYDPGDHSCTCGGTEAQCGEGNIWTADCECAPKLDAAVETSATEAGALSTNPATTAPDAGSSSQNATFGGADAGSDWGCYDSQSHECDCQLSESQCDAEDGIWTSECLCGALDAGQ